MSLKPRRNPVRMDISLTPILIGVGILWVLATPNWKDQVQAFVQKLTGQPAAIPTAVR